MKFVLLVCCLGIIMPSVFVAGDYVVEVLVQSYNNPTNQRSDGNCCDNGGRTNCDNGCDSYFSYCLRDLNTPVSGNRNCRSVILTSGVNNDAATINFTQPTVLGLSNPLVFRRGGAWEGTQLYVDVFDQDSNADDLIDVITVNIDSTSTPVGTSTTLPNLTGEYRYGMIGVTVTVMCADNYYGEVCQFLDTFDQCVINNVTCSGRGTCEDGIRNFTCNCESGFTGRDCETNINDCEGQSCSGRGTCQDLVNDYRCDCQSGYTGNDCENDVDECLMQSICSNHGNCTNAFGSFSCSCDVGFTGSTCEINIDDCVGVTCNGRGSCTDMVNGYVCVCVPGYTGDLCQVNIDDCVGVNCSGNGQCLDGVNNFICVCQSEFTGDLCTVEIQEGSLIGGIIGGLVGALVVLILVILLVLLLLTVLMKRNNGTNNRGFDEDTGTDDIETKANAVYGFSQRGESESIPCYDYIDPTTVARREQTQEHFEMTDNVLYAVKDSSTCARDEDSDNHYW